MLLNKDYRIILKFLNKYCDSGCKSSLISVSTKISLDDTIYILKDLEKNDYVYKLQNDNWKISYLGKNYRSIYNKLLFRSYIFPIITATISYILGLITNLILK